MRTSIIDEADDRYPDGVRDVPRVASWCRRGPPRLHVRGTLPSSPKVSIIGSRGASPAACEFARSLAASLATQGWCIVSGGAVGIDAAAHRGALDVDRTTVAVLTGGHDLTPFPPKHADLFAQIQKRGALVSLEADGQKRHRYQFLHRNAVLVAMTCATIVVHASHEGGAAKAARVASALGRPVFFVPESPWTEGARGSLEALRAGATPLWCLADAADLLAPYAVVTPRNMDPAQRALWRVTGPEATHVDRLSAAAGLPHAEVSEALLMLVLDGHLEEGPPGHYRRACAL